MFRSQVRIPDLYLIEAVHHRVPEAFLPLEVLERELVVFVAVSLVRIKPGQRGLGDLHDHRRDRGQRLGAWSKIWPL